MRKCLQGLVPRREQCFEGPRGMRLRYLTLPLTVSIPQTFSAMSLWEWSLAGFLMNRSVPHLPTLMGGGDLNKAGSMVMTMAGRPTWIPVRSISRYLLRYQRVFRVCMYWWARQAAPQLEWTKDTKNINTACLRTPSLHPSKQVHVPGTNRLCKALGQVLG